MSKKPPRTAGFTSAVTAPNLDNSRYQEASWEPLEEPLTPLQEIRTFFASLFTRQKLPLLAIGVIPAVLLLIAAAVFWPFGKPDVSSDDLAVQTINTIAPRQIELAEIEPGLGAESATTPQLMVQLGPDGTPETPPSVNGGDGVNGEDDAAAEETSGASPAAAAVAAAAQATAEQTSAEAAGSQTTQAPTTASPSTQAPTTQAPTTASPATQAPTTQAPTTQAPATQAPTTQAPATQAPTTQPPTTQAPTTQPPTTQAPTTQPPAGNCPGGGEFQSVYRDDFNGSSVGGHWAQYNSGGNAGYGLRRSSANQVYDGKLVITAQMQDGTLVSGGMSSGISQTYGKYVFRVRTDNDPTQATSGVVLTWPQSGAHPRDGENNMYETLWTSPVRNPFYTFIHKPYGSTSDQEYKEHRADASQWQTMTMEWTPSRITIIRDGTGSSETWTVNETGADLIPDVPHYMTIQLDAWKHSIGAPTRMEVDFVEIFKYCG